MKALFFIYLITTPSWANVTAHPTVEGSWTQLRKAPLFEADIQALPPVWGPSIPLGNEFILENSYGRWVFGSLVPIARMKKADYAPKGWVYNRMLASPDDPATRSREIERQIFLGEYYSVSTAKELAWSFQKGNLLYLTFLNSLVLSEYTLAQFSKLDEPPISFESWYRQLQLPHSFADFFFAPAFAEKTKEKRRRRPINLGFSGANLNFLQKEAEIVHRKHRAQQNADLSRILKAPVIEAANDFVKEYVLGKYLADKQFVLPALSHEEVDAHLYLRAILTRTLRACPETVQNYWKIRPWTAYRMKTLAGRPSGENLWIELELPGHQFFYSDQVLRIAENEAELAFILLRPMLFSMRAEKVVWPFGEHWQIGILQVSGNALDQLKAQQSTKLSKKMDVADEIAIDFLATQCIANAGYLYNAGHTYLGRLRQAKEADWAFWFTENAIGLDYRLEQLAAKTVNALAEGAIKKSAIINPQRLRAAKKLWNL